MSLSLSKEEFNILSNVNTLLDSVTLPNGLNLDKKDSIRKVITDNFQLPLLGAALGKDYRNVDDVVCLKSIVDSPKGNDEIVASALAEGLGVAYILGYFQLMHTDNSDSGEDLFGYRELPSTLKKVLLSCGGHYSTEDIKSKLETGLVISVNDISIFDYFNQGLYHQDIDRLNKLLLSDIDDGYNVGIKNALRNNGNIKTSIQRALKDLRALYNFTFADGFGIAPYVGVLLDDSSFITINSDSISGIASTRSSKIVNGDKILSLLANRLTKRLKNDMTFSDKRQFDFNEILNNSKPTYFPYKILEYALGKESTLNISRNDYRPSVYSLSWESYSAEYVFPNLEEILIRGCYFSFEKYLKDNKIINCSFIDSDFMLKTKVEGYDAFVDKNLDTATQYILNFTNKLVSSMTCVCILTKYPYVANEITAIYLRMTKITGSTSIVDDATFSDYLFKSLLNENKNEIIKPPFLLTDRETNEDGVALSANILEVQYDINPKLSKAEPLFGYVIQKQNQIKGKEASWSNILLGESPTGKEIYASKTSDIKLQDTFIHNIYAGSRAGKGVMTMNILVNALASGKPIFYLDRKPDMASMLYDIVGDNQFIVNGGLINSSFDLSGNFDESSGSAMKWFREITLPYLDSHPKIKALFGSSYSGKLGDYIYFRGWYFVMSLMVCRALLGSRNGNIRDTVLNGNSGIILVVDELTGAQSNLCNLLGGDSDLFKAAGKIGSLEEIKRKLKSIDKEITLAQVAMENAKNEQSRLKAQFKIEELEESKTDVMKYDSVYAATLFEKIRRSWGMVLDNKVASFKNKEFCYSDIFVLGQQLDAKFVTSSSIAEANATLSFGVVPVRATKDSSGNVKHLAAFADSDLIRSVFEEFGDEDWFIGRNAEGLNYANKLYDPIASQTTGTGGGDPKNDTGDGNWVYVGKKSCDQITMKSKTDFRYIPFKPYLVLNTSDEGNPPLEGTGVYQYVAQCADRVNKSAGGINLWDTVRLKHLSDIAKEHYSEDEKQYGNLQPGIGFKGLVEETLKTTKIGKEKLQAMSVDDYIVESLSKSGEIANYVAQKMGKSCWQELIFDLSPDGLYSFEDMLNALLENGKYDVEYRLELFTNLGISTGVDAPEDIETPSSSFEDRFSSIKFDSEPITSNDSSWDGSDEESWDSSPVESTQQPLSSIEAMRQQMMEDDWSDFDTEEEEVEEEVPQYVAKNYTEADVESLAYQIFGKFTFNHPEIALKIQNPAMKGVVFENCIASARQVLFGGVM